MFHHVTVVQFGLERQLYSTVEGNEGVEICVEVLQGSITQTTFISIGNGIGSVQGKNHYQPWPHCILLWVLYRLTTVTPPDVLPFVSTLTFELGDTQDCVSIPVVDDDLLEDTESFSVSIFSLSSPSAVVANRSFANVLIADNESKNQASFRHQKQLQIM